MRYEDEVKGKGKQVAGKVKEGVGNLAGDRALERFEGSVQQTAGKVRRKVGEALENLGDKIASKG